MSNLRFSQDSADARNPYEDTAFIERSRQQQRASQPRQQANGNYIQPGHNAKPPYTRDPYPQGYQTMGSQPYRTDKAGQRNGAAQSRPNRPASGNPQIRKPAPSVGTGMNTGSKAQAASAEAAVKVPQGPKVSKEVALQIEMVFKIGIMIWAAAALVTVIVLLTGA